MWKIVIQKGKIQSLFFPCGSQYQRGGVAAEEQSPRTFWPAQGWGDGQMQGRVLKLQLQGQGLWLSLRRPLENGPRLPWLWPQSWTWWATSNNSYKDGGSSLTSRHAPGSPLICSSNSMARVGPHTHGWSAVLSFPTVKGKTEMCPKNSPSLWLETLPCTWEAFS